MRLAIAALLVGALAGCSEGSYADQEKSVKGDTVRLFAELNAQAGLRAQETKATSYDIDIPYTALVLDRYEWGLEGSVYTDVTCPNGACGASLGTLVNPKVTPDMALRCPACGQELGTEIAGKAKPMFEVKSTSAPIIVVVRYVRRSFAHDPSSAVMVSSKTEQTVNIRPITETRAPGLYYAGGFYREVNAVVGVTAFVYKGGELRPVDAESVKKLTADPAETVSVSSMKTGTWDPIEKPLLPWLGRAPAAKPKEAPKKD
jgi:hypothetical protein